MATSTQLLAQHYFDDSILPENILLDGEDPWLFPKPFVVDFPLGRTDQHLGQASTDPSLGGLSDFERYVCLSEITSLPSGNPENAMQIEETFIESPDRPYARAPRISDSTPSLSHE